MTTRATIRKLADKVIDMRVFADEAGRMNLSLVDVHGSALIVSQFTLFADFSRGRRPSLLGAGDPARAEELYLAFVQRFREREIETKTGSFGADMAVNDRERRSGDPGPVVGRLADSCLSRAAAGCRTWPWAPSP